MCYQLILITPKNSMKGNYSAWHLIDSTGLKYYFKRKLLLKLKKITICQTVVNNLGKDEYINISGYNFNLMNISLIRREKNSLRRQCIESALIAQFSMINRRLGSDTISLIIAKAIVAQYGIPTITEKTSTWI